MLEFLTVAALVLLMLVALLVTAGWLVVRRVRRSRVVVAARQVAADGMLAVAACRPRAVPHRGAALQAVRVSRAHRLLRERTTAAQRAGAHLGEVPALLPRLEAEGARIRAELGRLVGSSAPGQELLARADRHLATLAELTGAVDTAARLPVRDEELARDAEEAALGLRLHAAAYTELVAADRRGVNERWSTPPFSTTTAEPAGTSCQSPGSAASGSETTTRDSAEKCSNLSTAG
jgi:hypothetical protein